MFKLTELTHLLIHLSLPRLSISIWILELDLLTRTKQTKYWPTGTEPQHNFSRRRSESVEVGSQENQQTRVRRTLTEPLAKTDVYRVIFCNFLFRTKNQVSWLKSLSRPFTVISGHFSLFQVIISHFKLFQIILDQFEPCQTNSGIFWRFRDILQIFA